MGKTHKCAAMGCTREIKNEYLMCQHHWFMLPDKMRSDIYDSHRAARRGKNGNIEAHRVNIRAAMQFIRTAELDQAKGGTDEGTPPENRAC